jgi:hypothetical protein
MAGIILAQGISLPPEGRFTFRREQIALFCSDFCHKSAIPEQNNEICSFPGLHHSKSEQNASICSDFRRQSAISEQKAHFCSRLNVSREEDQ